MVGNNDIPLLSAQEAALYDRQIRIWGADAQKRMGQASIFVFGISAAVAEACKNIVLAGIGSVTLLDDSPVDEHSADVTFLVSADELNEDSAKKTMAEVCAASLQDFNPMVKVTTQKGPLTDLPSNFLQGFSAVLFAHTFISELQNWNDICRKAPSEVKFFSVDCRWGCGRIFQDLGNHQFVVKGREKDPPETLTFFPLKEVQSVLWKTLPRRTPALFFAFQVLETWEEKHSKQRAFLNEAELVELFSTRDQLASLNGVDPSFVPDSLLKELVQSGPAEFAPTAAIIGGLLGQEILRAVSGMGKPCLNFLLFDHRQPEARIVAAIP